MNRLIKRLQGGQKGFTLIELLVVIAILGVISAVVALNLGGFFGEGTLQAANTELHQVQTAVIAAMAKCQTGTLESGDLWWAGDPDIIVACNISGNQGDAAHYVYGPFRAAYFISANGQVLEGDPGHEDVGDGWTGIEWNDEMMNWRAIP